MKRQKSPEVVLKPIIVRFDAHYSPYIKEIRYAVFILEQGIDEAIDLDQKDADAVHVLVRWGQRFVGTGRMLADGHIGRLAVLKEFRGKGIGAQAVNALVAEAKRRGMQRVFLGAQMHAVDFYKKLSFSEYGVPFLDAGIEHIHMEKRIV